MTCPEQLPTFALLSTLQPKTVEVSSTQTVTHGKIPTTTSLVETTSGSSVAPKKHSCAPKNHFSLAVSQSHSTSKGRTQTTIRVLLKDKVSLNPFNGELLNNSVEIVEVNMPIVNEISLSLDDKHPAVIKLARNIS